jgi:DNA mismatch repair protein MutS
VVFLHNIQEGPANRSFGLQVAKLAGIPDPVLKAARDKLRELELGRDRAGQTPAPAQAELFHEPAPHPVLEQLEALDVDSLSPRDALELLYRLHTQLH